MYTLHLLQAASYGHGREQAARMAIESDTSQTQRSLEQLHLIVDAVNAFSLSFPTTMSTAAEAIYRSLPLSCAACQEREKH